MSLRRRTFLKSVGLAAVAAPFARQVLAEPATFSPTPGAARTFELVTRMEMADAKGETRAWVPIPSHDLGDWFRAGAVGISGNAPRAGVGRDSRSGAKFVAAAWYGDTRPVLEVTSRFTTRDRAVDPSRPHNVERLGDAERAGDDRV